MELLSDDVVRSRLGFLHEGREVDWPKMFPEPVAEAAEESSPSRFGAADMPGPGASAAAAQRTAT